ncbi:MAG: hypothetical protein QM496_02945 [Verrucomicrobiota bacterium]
MIKYGMIVVAMCLFAGSVVAEDSERVRELEAKVKALEKKIDRLESSTAPAVARMGREQVVEKQKQRARARMRKDAAIYSRDELHEIEDLYQVANKKWQSKEGKESLLLLIDKFDEANRVGCALTYLAQMSRGDDREEYLEEAIDDYGDCYYGNGVQVGAYARFLLAHHYNETGEEDDAEELLEEILEDYPDSINHNGELLVDLIKSTRK